MPYADPEKQKEAQARWYRKKYEQDRKFRAVESERKAAWLQTPEGRMSNAESSARFRLLSGKKAEAKTGPRSRAPGRGKTSGPAMKPKVPARHGGPGKSAPPKRRVPIKHTPLKPRSQTRPRFADTASAKAVGVMKPATAARKDAMQYDESKPKEVKAFARMVQTLQGTGVKFVIARRGKRITLRVGV
jgi:hypothetical protein